MVAVLVPFVEFLNDIAQESESLSFCGVDCKTVYTSYPHLFRSTKVSKEIAMKTSLSKLPIKVQIFCNN